MAKRATIYIESQELYEQAKAKAEPVLSFSSLVNVLLQSYVDGHLEITIEGNADVASPNGWEYVTASFKGRTK